MAEFLVKFVAVNSMLRKILLISFLLLFNNLYCCAGHLHKEKVYQEQWCNKCGGQMEHVIDDGCRIDCLTSNHAIEFDFAQKWAESIGQALYYGIKTQRTPGIVLIIEDEQKELKYLNRLKRVAKVVGIDCWVMYESDLCNFKLRPVKL